MTRGGNKLVYQIEQAIKQINRIGTSKYEARKEGKRYIHSVSQVKKTLSVSQNFGKWLRAQGVKDLYSIKRRHYRDYIAEKQMSGVSNGHLINIETSLKILQWGMNELSKQKGFKEREWVPKKRLIPVVTREKPTNRSISREQNQELLKKLSHKAKTAKILQEAFGLRVRELALSTTEYIKEIDGKLYWIASDDKEASNKAQGVTKAGRARIAPCNPCAENEVRRILKHIPKGEKLVQLKYDSIRNAYYRAGIKGTHVFRHTYAREMMNNEIAQLEMDKEVAITILERYFEIKDFGNNSKYMSMLTSTVEWKQLLKAMNRVHSYLGHGEGRMDLARVYIRGF